MRSAPRLIPHYTIEDYRQWKGDWQLIDGIPIAMTPSPFGRHEQIVANCIHAFMTSIERQQCNCRVYAGLDWIMSHDTVVRPDVMVVCGNQPTRHLEQRPEIAVEVLSASTATQDQVTKRQLYQEHSVPYYLIIDPDTSRLLLWQRIEGTYQQLTTGDDCTITLPDGCQLEISSNRLLR